MDKRNHIRDIGDVRSFVLTKLPCLYGILIWPMQVVGLFYAEAAAEARVFWTVLLLLTVCYMAAYVWLIWYLMRLREPGRFLAACIHWGLTAAAFLLLAVRGSAELDGLMLLLTALVSGPFFPLYHFPARAAISWALLLFSAGMFGASLYGLTRKNS